jgi:hypothetical protein
VIEQLKQITRRILCVAFFAGSLFISVTPSFATGTPVNQQPVNGSTCPGTSVYFSWSVVSPTTTGYEFYVENDAGTEFSSGSFWGATPAYIDTEEPDNGEVMWWTVRAYDPANGGWGNWTDWIWCKNGPSGAPLAPNLVAPADSATLSSTSIAFQWNLAPRSSWESLQIATDQYFTGGAGQLLQNLTLDRTLYCPAILNAPDICAKTVTGFLNLGQTLKWRVSGWNDYGGGSGIWGPWSQIRTIFNGTVPSPPTPVGPNNGLGVGVPGSSIRFTWQPSTRILNYHLQVARDINFTPASIIHDKSYTGLQADVSGFADDGTQYWWRIAAHNYAGDSTATTRTFVNKLLSTDCAPAVGTGTGTVYPYFRDDIETCYVSTNAQPDWYLYDLSRRESSAPALHPHGHMPSSSAIETRKYVSSTVSETVGDIRPNGGNSAADDVWGDFSQGSAVDAHVNAGKFYDYLNTTHSINSYDALGASMVSLVDVPSAPTLNAYWDNARLRATYSISAGATAPYSGCLDMVGHVWGDAVTDHAAGRAAVPIPGMPGQTTMGLVPFWEPGALRIAFADWMGTAFEAESSGNEPTWLIGDCAITIRSLEDPRLYGQPDTYHGPGYQDLTPGNCTPGINDPTLDRDCGARINSGVPNQMFYLLAAGGTHNGVTVTGIGLTDAFAIALKANRLYWSNNVTFQSALNGMVSAADASQANQVKNAWAAVGVGTIPSISVTANPPEGGTVTGGGSYSFEASATVTATANPGFQFVNWTENGAQVSTSTSYNFTVNGSRSLVANFAVYAPNISVTPTAFDFGTYSVGQSSPPQTITVKNLGGGPLHLGSVSNGGINPSDFVVSSDNCSGQTLPLNSTCTMQVKFAPLASGPRGASLNIPSDDPDTPTFSVSLTGAVFTVQTVLVELPNADAGPNQGSPTPAVAHYLNVDDDPHDGDTTMLSFTSGGYKEVFTTADQLLDSDVITSLKVRWAAKRGSGADWTGKAGLLVAGQEYYGPVVSLGSSYLVREESFPRNPATSQTWSVQDVRSAKLIYQQVTTTAEVPRASLSEIVLEVTLQRMPAITVTASPAAGGTVTGGGMYPFGSPVIVTATANAGYVFVNWTESGVVVSTSSSYAFTAGGNRALVANFASSTPDIQVSPASINYGSYAVGEFSPAQFVTVTNQGYAPLNIGTVSIAGANPSDFVLAPDGCTGQSLTTGGSCILQVVFGPRSTGARSATLSIPSNDPDTPQVGIALTGSAPTIVYNLVELPNGDAGPNQGAPTPSGAHYLDVDDEPNDGDTTLLSFTSGGYKEVFTIADQLHDTDVITGVKVRWVAKRGSGTNWTAKAGLVVGGQEYYGPVVNLPANYTVREETFANNPATGQPWTVQDVRAAKLIYQQVTITTQLPKARLSEIVLVVSARRVPFSASLTELPNSDAGPNQGSPTPSVAHYLNVDDEPNDGDTTILTFSSGGFKEVYTFADQLLNTDLVTSVKVRWVAKKGSGSDWQAKAGLVVGGQEYYGATVQLPTNYTVFEETFANNPATGQPWTVQDVRAAKLIYQQVTITTQLPRAKLTELVLVVSVQRMPVLATMTEKPNSDASPNQGTPTPSGAHYLNVDEDPHDSDTTVLKFAAGGNKEVYTTADQLLDTDHVQYVKVRWVAKKGSGSDWQAKAGLVVGGQEYYGTTVQLPTNYTIREETFANNPATSQPWTVQEVRAAKLIYQQVTTTAALPKAALTEIVLVVTVERAP